MEQYSPEQIEKLYADAISTINGTSNYNELYDFARTDDDRVPEVLLKALNSPNGRLQNYGAHALLVRASRLSEEEKQLYYEPLQEIIENRSEIPGWEDDPLNSIAVFRHLYKPFVMEPLVACLNADNKHFRISAMFEIATVLYEYHNIPYVISHVMDCLHHDEPLVRSAIGVAVAMSLRKSLIVYAYDHLLEALHDRDIHMRKHAFWNLSRIERDKLIDPYDTRAVPHLIQLLGDFTEIPRLITLPTPSENERVWIRSAASGMLHSMGDKAIPALRDALKSDDMKIRGEASILLLHRGETDVYETCIEYLRESNWFNYSNSIEHIELITTLAKYGKLSAIPILEGILLRYPHASPISGLHKKIYKAIDNIKTWATE